MTDYCTPAELRTQIEKTGTTGSGSDAALNCDYHRGQPSD